MTDRAAVALAWKALAGSAAGTGVEALTLAVRARPEAVLAAAAVATTAATFAALRRRSA